MFHYKDINKTQFDLIRTTRNEAGQYLAVNDFDKCFEAVLEIKRYIQIHKLHPSTFDNILSEVIAIGENLSVNKEITLAQFERYLLMHSEKLVNLN